MQTVFVQLTFKEIMMHSKFTRVGVLFAAAALSACGGGEFEISTDVEKIVTTLSAVRCERQPEHWKCTTTPAPAPAPTPAPPPAPAPSPAPAPAPVTNPFPTGQSSASMNLAGTQFDVRMYRPTALNGQPVKGILLIYHGTNRNASDYRTWAQPLADKYGFIVAATLFDSTRFDSSEYHRGNVDPGSTPDQWTSKYVPAVIDAVSAREGSTLPVYIFGFSAGGQFLSRVAAFEPLTNRTVRIVGGGASTYVLPTLGVYPNGEAAPYGMGSLPTVGEDEVLRYLGLNYSIIIGADDNDPNDSNLTGGAAAERQGTTRLDRAQKTFQYAQTKAMQRGTPFGWDMYVVPGVAHEAAKILRSPELQQAFRLPNPSQL